MGNPVSGEKKERGRPWQRAATRSAILAAARRLAGRNGIDRLSLTGVAREADFAPATVFAYFANRNDLFLAILADDLAQFAKTMRSVQAAALSQANPPQQPAAARSDARTPQEAAASGPANRLRLVEKANGGVDFDTDYSDTSDSPPAEQIAANLMQELAPDDAANSPRPVPSEPPQASRAFVQELETLKEAVARLEARPVDAWLERRLREFERGLAALESRPEKPDGSSAQAAVEESVRALQARLQAIETWQQAAETTARDLAARALSAEQRAREEVSRIDAEHSRTASRIDALENAAFAAAPDFFPAKAQGARENHVQAGGAEQIAQEQQPAQQAAPTAQDGANAEAVVTTDAAATTDTVAATDAVATTEAAPAKSFLSAARQSALAAAEQSASNEKRSGRVRRASRRTLSYIAAGLGFCVTLIWVGVFFRMASFSAASAHGATGTRATSVRHATIARLSARDLLMAQANAGNPKAELIVGLDLLDGANKDEASAAHWLSLAAGQGEPFAAFRLATLYQSGRGVASNAQQAFHWFESAAVKGNCKAMQDLAVAYAEGWGTAKNMQEAATWFARAASFGLTDAQFNLAVLYERGLGVPESLSDAYKWYRLAAARGDREAQSRVDALKSQLQSSDVAAAEESAAAFQTAPLDRDANFPPQSAAGAAG